LGGGVKILLLFCARRQVSIFGNKIRLHNWRKMGVLLTLVEQNSPIARLVCIGREKKGQ
jgi:hypothetical protein